MKSLRWCTVVATLLIIELAFSASAFAKIIPVKESLTPSQLEGVCSKAGGSFNAAPDGQGASCTKGNTTVQCTNNGKCNATAPGLVKGGKGKTIGLGTALGISKTPGTNAAPKKSAKPTATHDRREPSHPSKKK